MGSLASDSMIKRIYQCMCSIDSGQAAPTTSGKTSASTVSGVGREQLVIFLADTLRGTAEERAPLVLAMSQHGAGAGTVVSCEQVAEVSKLRLHSKFNVPAVLWFSSSLLCLLHPLLPPSYLTDIPLYFGPFLFSTVPAGPNLCCSSDSWPQRALAGLEAGENGWRLPRCPSPRRAYVFRTQTLR